MRRALRDFERLSVLALDRSLRAFVHRIKRQEMDYLILFQRVLVFQSAQNRQINRVVIFGARRQRGGQDNLFGGNFIDAERIAQREFVLRQRAGLVGA